MKVFWSRMTNSMSVVGIMLARKSVPVEFEDGLGERCYYGDSLKTNAWTKSRPPMVMILLSNGRKQAYLNYTAFCFLHNILCHAF
jgi:hypothetical protein